MRTVATSYIFASGSYALPHSSRMEDAAYLTNSKASLMSLGTKLNDLYEQEVNTTASLVECSFNWANAISLASNGFGSTSSIQVPIDQFVGSVVLHLRLPAPTANQTLPRGWGYAFLNFISYSLGASSTTQVVLQGRSILQTVLAQCATAERRSEVFRCAGEEQLGVPVVPSGQDAAKMDAYVILPLPFSSGCGAEKLPFDTTLLSQPITVQIAFNQASQVYGGSDAKPASFEIAEVILRQGKLTNQSASLRQVLVARPDLDYRMSFTHTQAFVSAPFQGVRASDNGVCQVTLNQFPNADLLGISFWVVKESDDIPVGGNSSNFCNTDVLSNVLVTFNGSVLFRLNGQQAYRLTNLLDAEMGASQWQGSVISAGAVAPFISAPKDMYMVHLDFSRARAACMPNHLPNTLRIPSQNLQVTFNTQFSSGTSYRLYATYYMNALAQCAGGTSAIIIG